MGSYGRLLLHVIRWTGNGSALTRKRAAAINHAGRLKIQLGAGVAAARRIVKMGLIEWFSSGVTLSSAFGSAAKRDGPAVATRPIPTFQLNTNICCFITAFLSI